MIKDHRRLGAIGEPQITWNLVRNAVQAMPDGGTLTIDFPPAGDGAVAIRFADTGKGMTPEERARMFEPFYSRFEGGRGLGMGVVERLVSDARGSIAVNTSPGAGTSIVLEFPRAADAGTVLLVNDILGAHTMNPVSGDFSVGASGQVLGRGGPRPFRGATIAGNLRALFQSVAGVGDDLRFFGQ